MAKARRAAKPAPKAAKSAKAKAPPAPLGDLAFHPATRDRWPDVEALFGANGACAGCWCQWWKQDGPTFKASKGATSKAALRRSVEGGEVPGVLAYADGAPVGWVAVEPRARYARLAKSRNLVAVDDAPVWSATCFFVKPGLRKRGLGAALLGAAADHARKEGAPVLEGYPVDSAAETAAAFIYPGKFSTFVKAGFTEVARQARTRPVMRLALGRARRGR